MGAMEVLLISLFQNGLAARCSPQLLRQTINGSVTFWDPVSNKTIEVPAENSIPPRPEMVGGVNSSLFTQTMKTGQLCYTGTASGVIDNPLEVCLCEGLKDAEKLFDHCQNLTKNGLWQPAQFNNTQITYDSPPRHTEIRPPYLTDSEENPEWLRKYPTVIKNFIFLAQDPSLERQFLDSADHFKVTPNTVQNAPTKRCSLHNNSRISPMFRTPNGAPTNPAVYHNLTEPRYTPNRNPQIGNSKRKDLEDDPILHSDYSDPEYYTLTMADIECSYNKNACLNKYKSELDMECNMLGEGYCSEDGHNHKNENTYFNTPTPGMCLFACQSLPNCAMYIWKTEPVGKISQTVRAVTARTAQDNNNAKNDDWKQDKLGPATQGGACFLIEYHPRKPRDQMIIPAFGSVYTSNYISNPAPDPFGRAKYTPDTLVDETGTVSGRCDQWEHQSTHVANGNAENIMNELQNQGIETEKSADITHAQACNVNVLGTTLISWTQGDPPGHANCNSSCCVDVGFLQSSLAAFKTDRSDCTGSVLTGENIAQKEAECIANEIAADPPSVYHNQKEYYQERDKKNSSSPVIHVYGKECQNPNIEVGAEERAINLVAPWEYVFPFFDTPPPVLVQSENLSNPLCQSMVYFSPRYNHLDSGESACTCPSVPEFISMTYEETDPHVNQYVQTFSKESRFVTQPSSGTKKTTLGSCKAVKAGFGWSGTQDTGLPVSGQGEVPIFVNETEISVPVYPSSTIKFNCKGLQDMNVRINQCLYGLPLHQKVGIIAESVQDLSLFCSIKERREQNRAKQNECCMSLNFTKNNQKSYSGMIIRRDMLVAMQAGGVR